MTSAAERPPTGNVALQHRIEQLEAVLKGMGEGLVLQDENNRLVTINDTALRMAGLASESEARVML